MHDAVKKALAAAGAAQAAAMELVEAARAEHPDDVVGELAVEMRSREVSEILADALGSTLDLLLDGWAGTGGPDDEREMHGQLRAAIGRYLEGWA